MFAEEHNTKLSTSANETNVKQCRLCELLEDSSSHKLLPLLVEAYRVFIPRYITKGEAFLASVVKCRDLIVLLTSTAAFSNN